MCIRDRFVAGAAIQWLRDEVKIVDAAPDSEFFCNKVPDTNGCLSLIHIFNSSQ